MTLLSFTMLWHCLQNNLNCRSFQLFTTPKWTHQHWLFDRIKGHSKFRNSKKAHVFVYFDTQIRVQQTDFKTRSKLCPFKPFLWTNCFFEHSLSLQVQSYSFSKKVNSFKKIASWLSNKRLSVQKVSIP